MKQHERELEIPLKENVIHGLIVIKEWQHLATYLEEHFRLKVSDTGEYLNIKFSEKIVLVLVDLLKVIVSYSEWNEPMKLLVTELAKSLRNYGLNKQAQNYLIQEQYFNIIDDIISRSNNVVKAQKYFMQLILNMLTNEDNLQQIYNLFHTNVSKYFLTMQSYEVSALMYNINRFKEITDKEVVHRIIKLQEHNQTNSNKEFDRFLIEKVVTEHYFWDNYMGNEFSVEERIICLDYLKYKLVYDDFEITNTSNCLEALIKTFLLSTDVIFLNRSNESSAYELSNVLEIISILSSKEEYLKILQNNKDILIHAGVLLINIHRLGKIGDERYSPIQKLSEVTGENVELKEQPMFAFKADLIKLIGNLCWNNRTMQDLTRTAELIPVILDSCNIDAKNPFILQWAILCIRNLCENNLENQKIIAGLHRKGTVSTEALDEMGITLHSDGENELKIGCYNVNPK